MSRLWPVFLCLAAAVAAPVHAQPASAPLTLQSAIEEALTANPNVRRAREQLEEFRLQVRAVRAEALPTLDLAGTIQRTRDPGLRNSPFFSRFAAGDQPPPPGVLDAFRFGTYFYQVELEQPIYRFGRVRHALAAAREELEGVQADLRGVENRVAYDVARAYYDYLLARERRGVLEAEREARERQQVRDRLELGEATRLDLMQAEVALANLRPEVLTADNAIRVVLTRFNETRGRDPLEPFQPAARLAVPEELPAVPSVERLLVVADRLRPELQRFVLTRRRLEEAEGVTRTDTLPEISGRATFGFSSFKFDNLVEPSLHNWTVGVDVRWTLFDGHRARSTIGQYRSQRRQSLLDEEAFRARLASDLERATGDWRLALETVEVAGLAVDQATEARRVAEDLFSLGAATFLNVLDAERALRQAELIRLQAHHAAMSALAEVKTLVGVRPDAPAAALVPGPAPSGGASSP